MAVKQWKRSNASPPVQKQTNKQITKQIESGDVEKALKSSLYKVQQVEF